MLEKVQKVLIANPYRMFQRTLPVFFGKYLPEANICVASDAAQVIAEAWASVPDLIVIDELLALEESCGAIASNGGAYFTGVPLVRRLRRLKQCDLATIVVTTDACLVGHMTSDEYLCKLGLADCCDTVLPMPCKGIAFRIRALLAQQKAR